MKLTIGEVANRYLKFKQSTLRPASYHAAARYFELHWKALRPVPIGAVSRATVAAMLQEMAEAHGKVAAARARANLSALFGWAMREGLCESNPVVATNAPDAGVKPRERVLDDRELREIWRACGDDDFGRIVKLLILLGCRRSEIGDLRFSSELDLDTGVLTIPPERTKNHRALVLPLPAPALEILRSIPRREGRDHVFGGARGRGGFNAWSYFTLALNSRITTAIGRPLPDWSLHDIRRTMRSGLGKIGIRPDISELVIGHAKGGVEAIYDRYSYSAEIGNALSRWADHVTAVVENRGPSRVVPLIRA